MEVLKFYAIVFSTCIPISVSALKVNIGGTIDLENWQNLTHALRSLDDHEFHEKISPKAKDTSEDTIATNADEVNKEVKGYIAREGAPFAAAIPRNVNDNGKILHLMDVTCKEGIQYLKNLSTLTNNYKMRKRIKTALKKYTVIYKRFLKSTKKISIKSDLGEQRVISNILETFLRIVLRLTNYLIIELSANGLGPTAPIMEKCYRTKYKELADSICNYTCENLYVCGVCGSLSDFLIDAIGHILRVELHLFRQATDSIFENLKFAQMPFLQQPTRRTFRSLVKCLEAESSDVMRQKLIIFRNVIVNRNMPVTVMRDVKKSVCNLTMAFLDILNVFDKTILNTAKNKLRWSDYLYCLKDWSNGKRGDVQDIIDSILNYIMDSVKGKWGQEVTDALNNKFSIIHDAFF